MGASTFWNPQGLSRPEMGLLYLFYYVEVNVPAHSPGKNPRYPLNKGYRPV